MDRHGQLMAAWLEAEGQRQRCRLALPLRFEFPVVRGLIQLRLCIFMALLAGSLFVCWLASAWDRAGRESSINGLRLRGEQHIFHAKSGATVIRFTDQIIVLEPSGDPEVFHAKRGKIVFLGDEFIVVDP